MPNYLSNPSRRPSPPTIHPGSIRPLPSRHGTTTKQNFHYDDLRLPPERLPRPFRGGVDGAAAAAAGGFSASAGFVGTAAAVVAASRALGSAAPAPAEGVDRGNQLLKATVREGGGQGGKRVVVMVVVEMFR